MVSTNSQPPRRHPERPLVLLPAAGWGTRVGSPEAKEMLPWRHGRPLIERPVELALDLDFDVHVITRAQKIHLLTYLRESFPSVLIQLIEGTRDWPDTLLASEPYWHERNIVVLPDTEWAPENILTPLAKSLETHDLVWAAHNVRDVRTWGTITPLQPDLVQIWEKPPLQGPGSAWGLFGFRREAGRQLLCAQSESSHSHLPIELQLRHQSHQLTAFSDLTRKPRP